MAIVKANAYGHGVLPVAHALEPLVPAFGVTCLEEAVELREGGITKPVCLLEGTFSDDEIPLAAELGFWLSVVNKQQQQSILGASLKTPVTVWICVDSGMHRLGIAVDDIESTYRTLAASRNVASDIVIATHFACADALASDLTYRQLRQFKAGVASLANADTVPLSLDNSAGLLGWPETHADWNRPGIMLYGSSPFSVPHAEADRLHPVMTLCSAVIALRDVPVGDSVGYGARWSAQRPSRIATVAIGYGDGYPVHAPDGTPVLVNKQRCPMVGRVSMDMITVDVTDLPTVAVGDEVILWGKGLSVNEVAGCAGTISYELLTRMPRRVPRVYSD
ncbi:MAG: alanine racemase [Porticoccus sp.]|jgi:alanine racemase|tara:strand:+ start:53662 stop:54666 length:1005 start_codon:yes stop_codon:yes gene_type:complete